MKRKRLLLIVLGHMVAAFILLGNAHAQDNSGFIYGKVITIDETYEGQLRWGKEEIFWNDMFNAAKVENEYYKKLSEKYNKKKNSDWTEFDWSLSSIWEDRIATNHQFSCQFGDIDKLTDFSRNDLKVVIKNGENIEVNGSGYNDIGTTIRVQDRELGDITVRWDRIREIEFLETPGRLNMGKSSPLYGTVETYRKGTFTGFIQWDHDERVGTDKLDGDNRDGDVSLPFAEVAYIEKKRDGSIVELKSGREFYLTNSNDVDNDNRGIIMTVPGVGKIDIPWKYFMNARFTTAPNSGLSYDSYEKPKGLSGSVFTIEGDKIDGRLVFDLDETWEIEILNGNDDDVEYEIPFRNIRSIEPKNYAYSMIELTNGDKILLGGSRDVSDDNDGLLVLSPDGRSHQHVQWDKIVEIVFD